MDADSVPRGSDPISEHLHLKASFQSQASRWKEERARLDQEVQRRQARLDTLKGRMGRFMKECNEKIGQIGRERPRGTLGEYRLDVIYEQLDDHELRSLGRQAPQPLEGLFTPIDRDSGPESPASKHDFRLSRFSDASEVAHRNSASGLLLSNKKNPASDLFRAADTEDLPLDRKRRATEHAHATLPRGTTDSPDAISQLPPPDRRAGLASFANHNVHPRLTGAQSFLDIAPSSSLTHHSSRPLEDALVEELARYRRLQQQRAAMETGSLQQKYKLARFKANS